MPTETTLLKKPRTLLTFSQFSCNLVTQTTGTTTAVHSAEMMAAFTGKPMLSSGVHEAQV